MGEESDHRLVMTSTEKTRRGSPGLEATIDILSRLATLGYTWLMRPRFARWGRNSRIQHPALLQCPQAVVVGKGVLIREHAWICAGDNGPDSPVSLTIGDGAYIGRFAQINAGRDVVIEAHALIADRVFISDSEHCYEDIDIPIKDQGARFKAPVRIGAGCWIGIGAVVLPGVTIGRNAIVGANSVVTRDVPDFGVAAGVPAKVLRSLKE